MRYIFLLYTHEEKLGVVRSRRSRRWAGTGAATCAAATGWSLELGVGVARAITEKKRSENKQSHECHIWGLSFETGHALGGHMRWHREEMAFIGGAGGDDQWVIALPRQVMVGHGADFFFKKRGSPSLCINRCIWPFLLLY
jgi:hypothetical protein